VILRQAVGSVLMGDRPWSYMLGARILAYLFQLCKSLNAERYNNEVDERIADRIATLLPRVVCSGVDEWARTL
jgi:hypothetical protein